MRTSATLSSAMLLPISHEKMTVRRWPIVTVSLIAVTLAVHLLTSLLASSQEERVVSAIVAAQELYLERPSMGVCAPLKPFFNGPLAAGSPIFGGGSKVAGDPAKQKALADDYAAACHDLASTVESLPSQRFGYVPARANFVGLFTYMFMHADWWHVIGNMWFLFLCGLALEDRWGRLAFGAYYVVAGVVAAGVHHLASPASTAGLVGASGAVAGAMGAFVVLFATTRIRFVGFLGFRVVSFAAPAYVMLPLWAAVELLYGLLRTSSGTAHWAHVGGFLFGLGVAGAFRAFGVDRRLDDAVERAAVIGDDPRIDAARAMITAGDAAQAVALLEGLAKEKPGSTHVMDALREARDVAGPPSVAPSGGASARPFAAARPSASTRPAASPASSASVPVAQPRSSPPAPVPRSSPPAPVPRSSPPAPVPEGAPYFPAPPPRK